MQSEDEKPKGPKLNPRQEAFVRSYARYGNATRAARDAGYSERSAEVTGFRLLRNAKIQAALQAIYEDRQKKYEVNEERLMRELASIAFFNIFDVFDIEDGRLKLRPIDQIPERAQAAIESISETSSGGIKIKTYSKTAAIELLGRQIGMFRDDKPNGDDSGHRKAVIKRLQDHLRKRIGGGGGGGST